MTIGYTVVINNDNMDLITSLKNWGLDDREAAIYLASLQLGPAVVQRVAQKAGVKRTTTYLVAKDLKEKGLMSEFRNRQGIHLVAEAPEALINSLQARERRVRDILPELRAITNKQSTKPNITFYEGREGIREVCEDTLGTPNSEMLFISSLADIYKIVSPSYDKEYYIPERLKKNIKCRMLVFRDRETEAMAREDKQKNRETRFLPATFDFNATQFIYGNKIAYVSSEKELVGVIIESEDIAKLERQKYEMIWGLINSKKIETKTAIV